ncbi:hypothetical protein PYW07_013008 [Mythimna separata]|uniref:Uncharacterized protein n=1 Tax=Mythimna separata TaxID=271217 RepID=A0AAD7Y5R4_MYTSE|nr:hypothetical protein PYW07_013008 [Mythimna separata]
MTLRTYSFFSIQSFGTTIKSICGRKMCCKTGMQIQPVLFLLFAFAAVTLACQPISVKSSTKCILPPHPSNGWYEVAGDPGAKPGDEAEYVFLNVSCLRGYGVLGTDVAMCILGEWSTSLPQCVPVCDIQEQRSVTYSCKKPGTAWFGECGAYEALDTSAQPQCRPGYYSDGDLPQMRCVAGAWTNQAKCLPECGRVSGDGSTSPWTVFIFRSLSKKYTTARYICIGNIISENIVVSAAHCFWTEFNNEPKMYYMVVVGTKTFSDTDSSAKFPITDIKLPVRFQGMTGNYQHDIALVTLSRPFTFTPQLQPVCLDLDHIFNEKQLQDGNLGTVAVLSNNRSKEQQKPLMVQRYPYISIEKCLQKSRPSFVEFITADKFCAGRDNDTYICKGNSGSGLTFPETRRGVERHYLLGVVTLAPTTEEECAATDFALYTEIYSHKHFIEDTLATSASLPTRVEVGGI